MRRTLAVLALSGLAATVVGSAATLTVDGNVIQAGTAVSVACDANGIDANWGLETDDNTVRSVRFSDVDAACAGADMFVQLYDEDGALLGSRMKATAVAGSTSFPLSPFQAPETIGSVKVWIEG
jgi:hypothetical protein